MQHLSSDKDSGIQDDGELARLKVELQATLGEEELDKLHHTALADSEESDRGSQHSTSASQEEEQITLSPGKNVNKSPAEAAGKPAGM